MLVTGSYKVLTKGILTILLVGMHSFFFAQDTKTNNNPKRGKWIVYGKEKPDSLLERNIQSYTGYVENYRKIIDSTGRIDSVLFEKGYYDEDRKEGPWTRYYDDGKTPKVISEYRNNRLFGKYWKYWNNGNLREVGSYIKNLQQDSLKRYSYGGILEYEAWYNENGKEHGKVNYFYENSQLEFTFTVGNGIPIDTAFRYYSNGDLKEIIVYGTNGMVLSADPFDAIHPLKPIVTKKESDLPPPDLSKKPGSYTGDKLPSGYHKILNEAGQIWLDGIFKDGILMDGKEYVYNDQGILLKVHIFKSGVHHSDK